MTEAKWTGLYFMTVCLYASVAVNVGMGVACLWAGHQVHQLQLTLSKNQYIMVKMIRKYGAIDTLDAQINWKKASLDNLKISLAESAP